MEERRLGPVVGLGIRNTFGGDEAAAPAAVAGALAVGVRLVGFSPLDQTERSSAAAFRALGSRRPALVATTFWTASAREARRQHEARLAPIVRVEIERVRDLVAREAHLPWPEVERGAQWIGRAGLTRYGPAAFEEPAVA